MDEKTDIPRYWSIGWISFAILVGGAIFQTLNVLKFFIFCLLGLFGSVAFQVGILLYYFNKEDPEIQALQRTANDITDDKLPEDSRVCSLDGPFKLILTGSQLNFIDLKGPVGMGHNIKLSGHLSIQMVGKRKEKSQYFCELMNKVLFYTKKRESKLSNILPNDRSQHKGERFKMFLSGAQVRRVRDNEIRSMKHAIEVIHPQRKILYKVDYLYLIADSEIDAERWYFALLNVCQRYNGSINIEINNLLHDQFRLYWKLEEPTNWINAIWLRFHMNMRKSKRVREKLIKKMAVRLGEKIEEKNWHDYLSNIEIENLDVGSTPPIVESASLLPPDENGDLVADLKLIYKNGDAKMTMKAFVKKISLAISITATIKSLYGKMMLRFNPYPAERFSICFYEEPKIVMDVDIVLGNSDKASSVKSFLAPKLEGMFETKLKSALFERFVYPNRKYFRIPTTINTDPPAPHETSIFVKTELTPM